jgi:hypothetical protein
VFVKGFECVFMSIVCECLSMVYDVWLSVVVIHIIDCGFWLALLVYT